MIGTLHFVVYQHIMVTEFEWTGRIRVVGPRFGLQPGDGFQIPDALRVHRQPQSPEDA